MTEKKRKTTKVSQSSEKKTRTGEQHPTPLDAYFESLGIETKYAEPFVEQNITDIAGFINHLPQQSTFSEMVQFLHGKRLKSKAATLILTNLKNSKMISIKESDDEEEEYKEDNVPYGKTDTLQLPEHDSSAIREFQKQFPHLGHLLPDVGVKGMLIFSLSNSSYIFDR